MPATHHTSAPAREPSAANAPDTPSMAKTGTRLDLLFPGVLLAVWVAAAVVVNPVAELPLNDDWAYGHVVRHLLATGELRFTGWQSMPLITHVLWGALFAAPMGFSFTALRVSTLVLGYVGGAGLYGLLREGGARPAVAFASALALCAHPIYFSLSFTFMTDVPFVAWSVLSLWAWMRAERLDSRPLRALALTLALVATLNRQLGLALFLGFAVSVFLRTTPRWRGLLRACLLVALGVGALVVYERIVDATIGLPSLYHEKSRAFAHALRELLAGRSLRFPIERTVIAAAHLGAFVAPLVWVATAHARTSASRRHTLMRALGAITIAAALFLGGAPSTMEGHALMPGGVGAATIDGGFPEVSRLWWIPLLLLGGWGATWVLGSLTPALASALAPISPARWRARLEGHASGLAPGLAALLLVVVGATHFPTTIAHAAYFDRYVVALVPATLLLVWAYLDGKSAPRPSPPSPRARLYRAAAGALLAAALVFDVTATHDYLAWQRARWRAADRLAERGVTPSEIRGGFEVDRYGPWGEPRVDIVSGEDAPYRIALDVREGDHPEFTETTGAWLPSSPAEIHVSRRMP